MYKVFTERTSTYWARVGRTGPTSSSPFSRNYGLRSWLVAREGGPTTCRIRHISS